MGSHRILFIDAYDSFSNSIIALLRTELRVTVESIKIDDPRFVLNDDAFFAFLYGFSAVVAGPGPGHPANPKDIGLIGKLWDLPEEHILPVLGICLGFQSLCLAFGANVHRLNEPRHGIRAMITHSGNEVYSGAGKVFATQYHSLHVRLDGGDSESWEPSTLWKPSKHCPKLRPLAWDLMGIVNGTVLMGVRHCNKPYWGVQYHPESICTNKEGYKLIGSWWEEACTWRSLHNVDRCGVENGTARMLNRHGANGMSGNISRMQNGHATNNTPQNVSTRHVIWDSLFASPLLDVADVVEMLRRGFVNVEPLLLESGTRDGKPVNPETGRFSIIGLPDVSSMHIRYSSAHDYLDIVHDRKLVSQTCMSVHQALAYIDEVMRDQKAADGPAKSPFWGGLVGYISYEAGLQTIDVSPSGARFDHPEMWCVLVDSRVGVDHVAGKIYVQSLLEGDKDWIQSVKTALAIHSTCITGPGTAVHGNPKIHASLVAGPQKEEYCQKVRACQAQLRAGESYELCLTDRSTFRTTADSWSLYRQLRTHNPAPFSAYLRLLSSQGPGFSIASSSPERFLSWSRSGQCQFRPIKGTVKKSPGMTRAKAEELLGSPKERAENLMIVDLIRHDLAGVKGVSQVRVPKLMAVEEYETVFQLVSVIEGDLQQQQPISSKVASSGISVLAASLPPGSMTGAPKKRSCELLQAIEEGKPRGLYSGVIGFFDVGGAGEFSVAIRTAFKWDDEGDGWSIGAGGAVTALSEPEAEWEEMVTKRESVLNALLSQTGKEKDMTVD